MLETLSYTLFIAMDTVMIMIKVGTTTTIIIMIKVVAVGAVSVVAIVSALITVDVAADLALVPSATTESKRHFVAGGDYCYTRLWLRRRYSKSTQVGMGFVSVG